MNDMQTVNSPQSKDVMRRFAENYDIPVMGITNMGGKPYVNATGLMHKAKQIGLKSIKIDIEKQATKEDLSAVVKATVKLKDGSEYEDYGFGSAESIKMSTLKNPDFITMTTITRAKNRALRSATGFGLVSAEEMVAADQLYSGGSIESTGTNLDAIPPPKVSLGKLEKKPEEQLEGIAEEARITVEGYTDLTDLFSKDKLTGTDEHIEKLVDEVFSAEEPKEELTAREKKEIELLDLVEARPAFNADKMFSYFMVQNMSELSESQLDACIERVKKDLPF